MPTLHQLDWADWGTMFMFPNGTIFSIDANGYMTLSYGKPIPVNTNVPPDTNDDGSRDRCVQLAMAHLSLPVPVEQVSDTQLDKLLAESEVVQWDSTVADFINSHRTGTYFVVSYNGNGTHAWALVDGTARNITYQTLARHTRKVWKIR